MRELERRGNPRKKENQIKGWKSETDIAKLLIEHFAKLSKDGNCPDLSTARRKVAVWIDEFEVAQNSPQ
jgi:hypothetical protein